MTDGERHVLVIANETVRGRKLIEGHLEVVDRRPQVLIGAGDARVPIGRDAEAHLEGVVVGCDCAHRPGDRVASRDGRSVSR